MENGEKRKVLDTIFSDLINKHPDGNVLKFHNNLVKSVSADKFRNQFDVTKCDTPKLLPKTVLEKGYFIVHLGLGEHAFVKGEGYHDFEKIRKIKEWTIEKSVLDEISQSEAQSASTAFNNKIIHDFLFGDTKINLQLHTARRAKITYDFKVGGEKLTAKSLQIELDGVYESSDKETIATIEVKNKDNECFEVRQLYSAMRYCEQMIPNNYKVRLLFLVRIKDKNRDLFNLYEYKFRDKNELTSIEFVDAVSYHIISK